MESTDATIIGVYFLNYIKSISTCFGHYYAHHQATRKRDWLTHHVKLPGCAGCSCMELRYGQCALLESCCSTLMSFKKYTPIIVASVGSIIHLILNCYISLQSSILGMQLNTSTFLCIYVNGKAILLKASTS
jgi:hypothetical protein